MHGELRRIAGQCVPPEMGRFPALEAGLLAAVEAFIDKGAVSFRWAKLLGSDSFLTWPWTVYTQLTGTTLLAYALAEGTDSH